MTQPANCERCLGRLYSSVMSSLNTDIICLPCAKDEMALPSYQAGAAAEGAAVLAGNTNFPGVGLTDEDRVFLQQRRSERAAVAAGDA